MHQIHAKGSRCHPGQHPLKSGGKTDSGTQSHQAHRHRQYQRAAVSLQLESGQHAEPVCQPQAGPAAKESSRHPDGFQLFKPPIPAQGGTHHIEDDQPGKMAAAPQSEILRQRIGQRSVQAEQPGKPSCKLSQLPPVQAVQKRIQPGHHKAQGHIGRDVPILIRGNRQQCTQKTAFRKDWPVNAGSRQKHQQAVKKGLQPESGHPVYREPGLFLPQAHIAADQGKAVHCAKGQHPQQLGRPGILPGIQDSAMEQQMVYHHQIHGKQPQEINARISFYLLHTLFPFSKKHRRAARTAVQEDSRLTGTSSYLRKRLRGRRRWSW